MVGMLQDERPLCAVLALDAFKIDRDRRLLRAPGCVEEFHFEQSCEPSIRITRCCERTSLEIFRIGNLVELRLTSLLGPLDFCCVIDAFWGIIIIVARIEFFLSEVPQRPSCAGSSLPTFLRGFRRLFFFCVLSGHRGWTR